MGILPIVAIGAFALSKLKKNSTEAIEPTVVSITDDSARLKAVARAQALKNKILEAKAKAGKRVY